ncbi:hypothetical protein [Geomonas subterranea]|uniref:hypothetical protein n=1 Tax=Geomonas subterranea TaxID=2847989 RepID=UPI001CD44EF6|nr:hypothetical protein [Geomonas fuzhouensis]
MEEIKEILAAQYRGEINQEEAVRQLTVACTHEELAEFIVAAKNRGWISNFNLGLDEDGHQM